MSATMKEIAKEVGVSQATVSYVLNGRENKSISEATRRSVAETAERLGYRTNRLARAMVTSRTGLLGALVGTLPGTWDARLAGAIEDTAFEHDCSVLLGCSHWDPVRERRLMETFLENRVDGVLVLPTVGADAGWYQELVDEGVHIVFMVTAPVGVEADTVGTDNHRAGYLVGRHLAGLGRRHFAYVCPPVLPYPESEQRLAGFAAAARDSGLDRPGLVQAPPSAGWGGIYAAMVKYLRSGAPVDAVFAFNDLTAMDAMRALQDEGQRVPEDVAVVGFDDLAQAAEVTPALTTVRVMREIGKHAVETLLRRTQAEEAFPAPQHVLLEPTLVVRESTLGLQA